MVGGAFAWARALPTLRAVGVRRGRELSPAQVMPVLMEILEQEVG